MATYQITGIRTESRMLHDHITDVRIGSGPGFMLSVETVMQDLRTYGGDRYHTFAGGYRADVIVRDCPRCGHPDYITTKPDTTTANNLLSLPRV